MHTFLLHCAVILNVKYIKDNLQRVEAVLQCYSCPSLWSSSHRATQRTGVDRCWVLKVPRREDSVSLFKAFSGSEQTRVLFQRP